MYFFLLLVENKFCIICFRQCHLLFFAMDIENKFYICSPCLTCYTLLEYYSANFCFHSLHFHVIIFTFCSLHSKKFKNIFFFHLGLSSSIEPMIFLRESDVEEHQLYTWVSLITEVLLIRSIYLSNGCENTLSQSDWKSKYMYSAWPKQKVPLNKKVSHNI